jgi:hypothetical protein
MEPPITGHDAFSRDDMLVRQTTMTRVITRQSAENMAYVRRLLQEKQPGFSAALELALMLAELELTWPAGRGPGAE